MIEEDLRVYLWMGVVVWMYPNQKVILLISTNQSTRNATSTPSQHMNWYYILKSPSTSDLCFILNVTFHCENKTYTILKPYKITNLCVDFGSLTTGATL